MEGGEAEEIPLGGMKNDALQKNKPKPKKVKSDSSLSWGLQIQVIPDM